MHINAINSQKWGVCKRDHGIHNAPHPSTPQHQNKRRQKEVVQQSFWDNLMKFHYA